MRKDIDSLSKENNVENLLSGIVIKILDLSNFIQYCVSLERG